MEISEHVAFLGREGRGLADAAAACGLDAVVPGCPDWTVRDLVAHVGEVHRWAATVVGEAMAKPAVDPPVVPGDDELVDWFRAGHAALIETLVAAPADLECFAFLPAPSALAFWARRQALETAIHRGDAEGAGGGVSSYDEALALDGMDELLNGFGARKKVFEPGVVRLDPAGADPWFVTLGAEGLSASRELAAADVTVSGTRSALFRWMWNRPANVAIDGDETLAREWQKIRVRWG